MATQLSMDELRTMPLADLQRETIKQRLVVAKMHVGISMQKEKDTAKYRGERKLLARMLTVMGEKNQEKALQKPKKPRRLPSGP